MSLNVSTRNTILHALDGLFFCAGLVVLSYQVTIPQMITELRDSDLLLGLVPFIVSLGMVLPQLFHAKAVEGLPYKKRRVLLCALLQRTGWLVFFGSLFIHWGAPFTLIVFFCVLAVNSLGSGMIIPVWTDWFAKTAPEKIWGKILGIRWTASGVLGIALGHFFIRRVMATFPSPERYQIIVGTAIACYALSFVSLALVKEEPEHGLPDQGQTRWLDYFKELAWILFRRRDFRKFMLASQLAALPIVIMMAFLTKYGLTYTDVSGEVAGSFTLFFFGASAVGALVGGSLSDRLGTITPFRVFPVSAIAAAVVAYTSRDPFTVSVAFSLLGLAFGARIVVLLPAVFRYSGKDRRPTYTAVSYVFLTLGAALVPPVIGALLEAEVLSYPGMFIFCGFLSAAGWLLFLRLPEPQPAGASAVE